MVNCGPVEAGRRTKDRKRIIIGGIIRNNPALLPFCIGKDYHRNSAS